MLIRNFSGRIVEVSAERAKEMIEQDGATLINETPKRKGLAKNECPYCFEDCGHVEKCKENAPLISIIIPSRSNEKIDSMESLKNQSYQNIEIIVEIDEKKEGAPVCRNRGFEKSKGEFVLFSDNDLEWDKDAIAILYGTLIKNFKAAYSYGSYSLDGKLIGNKEFSSHDLWKWNYISTMSLIRKEDFPGFDESLKKFQDWDLWLTLLDKGREGKYCGECVFSTKVRENGITFGKDTPDSTTARAILMKKHSIKDTKLADIIIPHQNRHDMLHKCLDRLSHDNFNILVIGGGTFSENCNKGARIATTDNLIFMNDDIEPEDEVIRQMISSEADIVGAAQITPNWHKDKIWYGISYKWKNGFIAEEITDNFEQATIPTGFLFRVKKKVWEELGGLDEAYKNGGEDQEIFLTALEKGYSIEIIQTPTVHHHSSSRDRFKHTSDNRTLLNSRWTKERIGKILNKQNG